MKKILYMVSLLAVIFAGCDPMEDVYNDLDAKGGDKNIQELEYTLTDADYSAIGDNPAKYKSFSSYDPAADFLPAFLGEKYATLDENSVINVTYMYYQGSLTYLKDYLAYLEDLAAIESYTLSTADYDSMGTGSGEPGQYNNFSSSTPAADYLPDFLLTKYPDAVQGDEVAVTYKYYDGSVSEITEFWAFDGSVWAQSEKVAPEIPDGVTLYELEADDYDSMGTPGKYNNFSSSDAPENYLSTFLGEKFPYAAEGDKIATVYKYYAGGGVTETRAKEYTLTDGVWVEYASTVAKTDQYIRLASGWLFDPTVLYTMTSDDYQIIVDYVKDNVSADYLDSYGTADFYYGAGAHYSNFDLRDGKYDSATFATWDEAVKEGLKTAFLPNKFPEAVAQVEGVDVHYIVTFATYDGSNGLYSMDFVCTKSAPNPTFDYVDGPTAQ